MAQILDLLAAILVLLGSFFCLSAALGIVRFPDVMTRLHAATKPQVFGLILVLTGMALVLWSWKVTTLVLLIIALQIMTAPVAAHMVSRTAYRLGLWNDSEALVDELGEDLEDAGYSHPVEEAPDAGHLAKGQRWKSAAIPARPRRDGG